jgi:hypothetical protein
MRTRLALNHTFLEGIAALPVEQVVERTRALQAVRARAAAEVFAAEPLYVHRDLGMTLVASPTQPMLTLRQWLAQVTTISHIGALSSEILLRRAAELLLDQIRGPYWQDLPNPVTTPLSIMPDVSHAALHAQELVAHGLGYLSQSGVAPLCAVSLVDPHNLIEPEYSTSLQGQSVRLQNLRQRSDLEAYAAQPGTARATLGTVADVFQLVEQESAGGILFLPSAHSSAVAFDWRSCGFDLLLRCLLGLRHYRSARDQGQTDPQALDCYQQLTGIEASMELPITMLKPACRAARTFQLPDGRSAIFEAHAKPRRTAPRVHFCWERLPSGASVVYIGHCGHHLQT